MLDRSVVGSDRRIGTALSRFITAGTSSIRWELALRPFAFTFISLLLDLKLDSSVVGGILRGNCPVRWNTALLYVSLGHLHYDQLYYLFNAYTRNVYVTYCMQPTTCKPTILSIPVHRP
uniref:Uncharacterized protein n=1 Tax=Picea glauca TaxID=3330 RepID=A0A117NGN1_PICGL|nr:hypothetical protein ABT39_MTgene6064 [Picea glauca]